MKKIYNLPLLMGLLFSFITFSQVPTTPPKLRTTKFLTYFEKDTAKIKEEPSSFQNNSASSSLIPPTPEAASLGKYGASPVAMYTGVPNISVPLYQIKQKDLSLDLSLSYHAGGIRVEETAPWTGLGWSLNGIGTITRTQRGSKADEQANGYMNNTYDLDSIYEWFQFSPNAHLTALNQFRNDYIASDPLDCEADIFNFNFGKYSGKFVYHKRDGVFYAVPRQNLKIEHSFDYSSWTITTEEGIKYVFGSGETTTFVVSNCSSSIGGAGNIPNATTAWNLTQIISPTDPTNVITINYAPDNLTLKTNGSARRFIPINFFCNFINSFNNSCQTTTTYQTPKISEIVFRNGKIAFQRNSSNRCDLDSKSLQKITLYDANNQRIKATEMFYSYFGSQSASSEDCGTESFLGRLRLDSLKNSGETDASALPPYRFDYEYANGFQPSVRSSGQDHWGFYNGSDGNSDLIPQHQYFDISVSKWKVVGDNNRDASPIVRFNQLNSIQYPTGGKTQFEFESNRYFQAICDPSACLNEESTPNNRISLFDENNGAFTTQNFSINQGAFCLNACQDGALATIQGIGSLLGTGFTDVQFIISSSNPAFSTIIIDSPSNILGFFPNGNYTITGVYNGSVDSGTLPALRNTSLGISWKIASNSEIPVGGLRVKSITDYDETAQVVSLRKYDYSQENSIHSSATLGQIPYYGEQRYLDIAECNEPIYGILLSSESTYPLINTQGSSVGYTNVTVSHGNNGENGKEIHTFKPVATYRANYGFPVVPTYMQDWKDGLSLTNSQLSATNVLLHADSSHHVVDIEPNQSLFKQTLGLRLSSIAGTPMIFVYTINGYQTATDWLFMDFTEEKIYHTNGSDVVKIPKWFEYNNQNFMLSLSKTINSLGDTLKTEMKYPHDFSSNAIYAGMLLKNQSGMVIETSEYVKKVGNNSYDFLMKKRNNFNQFNGSFYASSTNETQYAGGNLTQEASFQYANDALISSVTERNGITSTFTWFGTADVGKRDLLKTMVKGSGSTIAQTTNFDYKPLVGLSVVTLPTTYGTSYYFDALSRLNSVKDAQSFEIKRMFYHYQGQNAPTDLTLDLPKTSNYVASYTARNAQTTLDSITNNSTTSIAYMDGLGKSTQQILFKGSPDKSKDILLGTTVYDGQSRPKLSYLPTPSDVNTGVVNTNFQSLAKSFYDNDNNPYSETIYEESPLNRPLKTFGAGQAWRTANKFVEYDYLTAGGGFLDFKLTADGASGTTNGLSGNSLINSQVTSERGAKTIELKDRLGRVLYKLQQLDIGTFNFAISSYIYDDLNRLTYVLPPEINKQFGTNTELLQSFTENDVIFKEGIYAYHYDTRGRLSEKHIPGAGWTYFVYDKNDKLVMFADDSDKAKNYWQFKKYDALNRPIYTGLIGNTGTLNRSEIQTDFDNFNGQTYETVSNSGLFGYTNTSFPSRYLIEDDYVKLVTYYDDYVFNADDAFDFQPSTAFHAQANAKGMITGMLSRNLETNDWLKSVSYYDYKGRNIQTFFKNHKGNIERSDFQYRFNSEVLKMRLEHEGINEIYDYEYDHVGRKTSLKHTLNGALKNVARYEHDEIGRLKDKKISPTNDIGTQASGEWNSTNVWLNNVVPSINDHVFINENHVITIPNGQAGSAGSLFLGGILNNYGALKLGILPSTSGESILQTVDYSYHIRGGLRGINLDASGNLTNKLFSMRLDYETAGFYDGNIGKQEWKSSLDNVTRSFTYDYDGASRIKSGNYESTKAGENYSLNNVNYDLNSNITNLSRNGWKANNTFGLVDDLNYTYNSNANKILKVDDASNETASFRDVSGDDYTYYPDGSLKSDVNKGITDIQYNYLKLQDKVTFSNGKVIHYQYNSNGKKLREIASNGDTTNFFGNLIFKNNVLYEIKHDEGRVVNGSYEYNITDHLGNLRVAFKDSLGIAKIVQSNAYGIFGNELRGLMD
jgi:hypothetical protein